MALTRVGIGRVFREFQRTGTRYCTDSSQKVDVYISAAVPAWQMYASVLAFERDSEKVTTYE